VSFGKVCWAVSNMLVRTRWRCVFRGQLKFCIIPGHAQFWYKFLKVAGQVF
jgi:hypothetical protein